MKKKQLTAEERKFFAIGEPTIYISVTIKKDAKRNIWKVTVASKKGGWESANNFLELHPVNGQFVLMYITTPKAVFLTINQAAEYFRLNYKCEVTQVW